MASPLIRRLATLALVTLAAPVVGAQEPYLVRDIVPGIGPQFGSGPSLIQAGDRVFAFATTRERGRELWITDGTPAGTRLLRDICPGPCSPVLEWQWSLGERLLFSAWPVEPGEPAPFRPRLWVSDGTWQGTVPLGAPMLFDSQFDPSGVGFLEDRELWISDGTPAGTGSLQPLFPFPAVGVWSAGDRVRVAASGLWETDGTFAGTRRLLEPTVADFAEAGSLLFFRGGIDGSGPELMALPLGPPEPCLADAETLCLGGGRFAVTVRWRDPRSGDEGVGGALPLAGSDRTGLFWFFDPDNVELVVKSLAAGSVNGYFWNFYGALSDVEYTIEVEDIATGRRVEYFNPGGEICGRGDTTAFPARSPVPLPVPSPDSTPVRSIGAGGAGGTACGGAATDLCLLGDRFRVEVEWTDQRSGDSGVGTAVPGTDRSGFFWFFNDQNVELVVKMLDGRPVNGRFWVFYGALSDVEYTITVTETESGDQAIYHNPPGEICGRGDTAAF